MSRFGEVKFNLMRAIEIFQDMNHEDMDVTAPPSGRDHYKEHEVATRLNEFLGQLIDEGIFEDCDLRDDESEETSETDGTQESGQMSYPDSEGFEYDDHSGGHSSRESFTGRFKRYIRRILPGRRGSRRNDEEEEEEEEEERDLGDEETENSDGGSLSDSGRRRSESSRSLSRSLSRERSGSEPFDPNLVLAHSHRHKHRHFRSHHHHSHGPDHEHTYHTHEEDERAMDEPDHDDGGVSDVYGPDSDELSSTALVSQSESASPRSQQYRSRSQSRSRSRPQSRASSRRSSGSRSRR